MNITLFGNDEEEKSYSPRRFKASALSVVFNSPNFAGAAL
jgi:hypothetical protein